MREISDGRKKNAFSSSFSPMRRKPRCISPGLIGRSPSRLLRLALPEGFAQQNEPTELKRLALRNFSAIFVTKKQSRYGERAVLARSAAVPPGTFEVPLRRVEKRIAGLQTYLQFLNHLPPHRAAHSHGTRSRFDSYLDLPTRSGRGDTKLELISPTQLEYYGQCPQRSCSAQSSARRDEDRARAADQHP